MAALNSQSLIIKTKLPLPLLLSTAIIKSEQKNRHGLRLIEQPNTVARVRLFRVATLEAADFANGSETA